MEKDEAQLLRLVDMHTAGEPVRIIDARHLDLPGESLLEQRAAFRQRFDHIRRAAMMEPRGHADMYGVVLVRPSSDRFEAGAIFTHVSGYSSMCGHVSIALGRFLGEELGWGTGEDNVIECPCGPVTLHTPRQGDGDALTGFTNVPARIGESGGEVTLADGNNVRFDVCYGGAYYAVLPKQSVSHDLDFTDLDKLRDYLGRLVQAIRAKGPLAYEPNPELAYLYGAILTEGDALEPERIHRHICWFGESQIDRSPTGSGVSARLAQSFAAGHAKIGVPYHFAGASGESFEGIITRAEGQSVETQVWGRSYFTGEMVMRLESDDPLGNGFFPAAFPDG